jgi:hypothetical protein
MSRRLARLVVLAAWIGMTGCGPIQASTAIGNARDDLARALKAGADADSPYETTAAGLYLDQARVLEGQSEFQAARTMAEKARKHAGDAIRNAPENRILREARERAAAKARESVPSDASGATTGQSGSGEAGP